MRNYVFYSWQSDLDGKNNRNFIEECIKKALKELNKSDKFYIEFCIDRDTKNKNGTPDIVNTIFSKIDNAKLFIADVSIINSDYNGRKTPNPNVLIELGYAARVLGWDKIICIYNTDYGTFDDLPFDIKSRRPLSYSIKDNNKLDVKKGLIEAIKKNITSISSEEFVSINDVGSYLILESSEFYKQLQNDVTEILNDSKIQEKYKFTKNNYVVEVWDDIDYRIENNEPVEDKDIQYFVDVEFEDDKYSNKNVKDRNCSVSFQLSEKFKQINFNNFRVYSALEIISRGYTPTGKRDYEELSNEIMKRLNNAPDK